MAYAYETWLAPINRQSIAILFLPDQKKLPGRPVGPTIVQLPNAEHWEFKLVKVACNVAAPVGEKQNQLSKLLQ